MIRHDHVNVIEESKYDCDEINQKICLQTLKTLKLFMALFIKCHKCEVTPSSSRKVNTV